MGKYKHITDECLKGMTDSPEVQKLIKLNLITVEAIAEQYERQVEAVIKFKHELLPDWDIDKIMGGVDVMTPEQSMVSTLVLLNCLPDVLKFDDVMTNILPAFAVINVVANKHKELADLKEAIDG